MARYFFIYPFSFFLSKVTLLLLHGKKRAGYEFEGLKFDFSFTFPHVCEGSAVCNVDTAMPDDYEVFFLPITI
jgi:hypothetical protein